MAEESQEKLKLALAMLSSLKESIDKLGRLVHEKYVGEFHTALDILESIDIDVSPFRISDIQVKPRERSTQVHGEPTKYTKEKYVEQPFLATKLGGTIRYITTSSADAKIDSLATIANILSRFHQVARQLRDRHDSRPTLDINDEYDVQDLLHSLLRLNFEDIRTEEWTPSYAGGSSRMDFLLKNEQVVVEVKKTREGLRDSAIGEELIIDIRKYQEHPDCKTLVCFIYDPEGRLGNPIGLENDLAKNSTEHLNVKAFVFPK